jgi:thiol-disulfide isomerase/thioredoxin
MTRHVPADWRGRIVVLNFWATWCIPCVAELPSLDRLAASAPDFAVLAVSADRTGAEVVSPFLKAHGIAHLTTLLDPHMAAGQAFGVAGFPTTLVIDASGRLRGRLEGPADWAVAAGEIRGLVG